MSTGSRRRAQTTTQVGTAQADGTVRAGDPHELAAVLFASVPGIAALATPDLLDGVSQERTVEGAIDVAWRGIAGLAAS